MSDLKDVTGKYQPLPLDLLERVRDGLLVRWDGEALAGRKPATWVPEPVRGGTFCYCPWAAEHGNVLGPDTCKFRTAKAFRQHWRRVHAS